MKNKKQGKQKLLVIGMADSPHLRSWVSGIAELGMFKTISVFPTTSIVDFRSKFERNLLVKNAIPFSGSRVFQLIGSGLDRLFGNSWRSPLLRIVILSLRPSFIHVHEIQHGGYIFEWPKLLRVSSRPPLFCSSWGSDLIYYGNLPSHEKRLRYFLSKVDVLLAERVSESEIAQSLGFVKKFVAPVYVSIGFDPNEEILTMPSSRKLIVVKGYQDIHGRALNALKALEAIPEALQEFEVVVVSASESVKYEAERLRKELGISVRCLPRVSQNELKKILRQTRLVIGLSVSDGLPNLMLEAMQNGAFPIQSKNSGASSVIQHGISGFIVDPWNIEQVSTSIVVALNNDHFVNEAFRINVSNLDKKYNRRAGLELLRQLYIDQMQMFGR